MSKNKKAGNLVKSVDFTDLTPKMQIEKVKLPPFYEKAFFMKDEKMREEFGENTTTWE